MMRDYIRSICKKIRVDEEARFRMKTSLKIVCIPFISLSVLFALLLLILSVNLAFFEAHGYPGVVELREAYYDYVFKTLIDFFPWFCIFVIFVLIIGIYVSHLFLRPFRVIGDYCEGVVNGKKMVYDPEFFTDLKLLTSFSEYFFNQMENALQSGEFFPVTVMKKFRRIHEPVFERAFFINYLFFIVITSIVAALGLYAISVDIYMDLIKLSLQTLDSVPSTMTFFNKQYNIFHSLIWIVLFVHSVMYVFLSLKLYDDIARPAFAIFATMRSFLKGNFDQRVHLIGFKYVRSQSRRINKYLDYIQENVKLRKNNSGP
ncbi:MAG: hypothetical protein KAQ98_11205 [Bacteriovoracaceae bacterium]|nr:hypothetical protein [Bacteriovoracaceae bacterium]